MLNRYKISMNMTTISSNNDYIYWEDSWNEPVRTETSSANSL